MSDFKKPAVSIICNTFNHSKYIRDALDGFLMQKTDFPFEILVHDDASTDGTGDIIREYADKYPELIFPIIQNENQYSKGIKINQTYQYSRVQGKYIAVCEGDDYWTDPLKLQKQFDALEKMPGVDMCAHAVEFTENGKFLYIVAPSDDDRILTTDEVILGGGGFVATASLFYRKSIMDDPMDFIKKMNIDYFLQIYGSIRGGIYYIHDNMAVYRYMTESSWSSRMSKDKVRYTLHEIKCIETLKVLNLETSGKYEDSINNVILQDEFCLQWIKGGTELLSNKYSKIRKKMSSGERFKLFLKAFFPHLVNFVYKLR